MLMLKRYGWIMLLLLAVMAASLLPAQAQSGQVSGLVWLEKTVDGVFSNESGLADAVVTLEQQAEDGAIIEIARAVTGRSGDFSLAAPDAGDYRLRIELPSDYRFTLHGMASDALPAQGRVSVTPFFHVSGGQNVSKYIGATKNYATISLVAFEDLNANGGRMNSEPLISNAQVDVLYTYAGETYVVATDITDRSGEAVIRELSPGTYQVRISLPRNYAVGPLGQKISGWYNCFTPETEDTGITAPITVGVRENQGVGAGMVRAGSVEGSLWYDADFDGAWDQEEGGLREAEITLYSMTSGKSRTTHADAEGNYSFNRLQPGDYRLEFRLPEGMIFTYPGASALSNAASRAALSVSIQEGGTYRAGAVGVMRATGLTVSLYADLNGDGVRNEGEPAVENASVTAVQAGASPVTQSADGEGVARFAALRGGDTQIVVSLPEGAVFAAGQEALPVSGAQSLAEGTLFLDANQGETALTVAVTYPASISGMFFEDPANTGVYQPGSALLSGFTVQAVDAQGQVAAQAVTDAAGQYALSPLLPGDYTVRFLLGDTYVAAPFAGGQGDNTNHIQSQTPAYGETDVIALGAGASVQHINGGVFQAGVVDGYVLLANQAGGLQGVTVSLLDQEQQSAFDYAWGVTDENGFFSIKGLLPGTYTLLYTLPDNGAFTVPMTDEKTARSQPFVCSSGSQIHMPALTGEYTSSLSGHIISDTQSAVSAHLTLTNQATGAVWEAEADESNAYRFAGLRPGDYTLEVTLPDGLVFGYLASSPIPATPASRASAAFHFESGEVIDTADVRAALPLTLSGHVFYDDNMSGTQDADEYGAEGRNVSLWLADQEITAAETDGEGNFALSQLVPGTYVLRMAVDENEIVVGASALGAVEWQLPLELTGDQSVDVPVMRYASVSGQVWSLDGTYNGVSGLRVSLLDGSGRAVAAMLSGEDGSYDFGGLLPGEYQLSVTLPEEYMFARSMDTAQRDSFVQLAPDGTVASIPFTVPMGDELSGMDVGIGAVGGIGDRAWLDVNGNGMQDIDEPNMPGIVIELYRNGELAASAVTDEYGRYQLVNLHPGEYEMKVTMHPELRATKRVTEFPLVSSILPDDSDDTTLTFSGVIVPSGDMNLHCDLGFVLRTEGVYPAAMDQIPEKDWRPYSNR